MPIDPVKIPQNIYIEDHIVGPLTLRQTLIMAGGGGFSYAIYATLSKTAGPLSLATTIIVWIPCALAIIFALVKVNDLSLLRICFLMLERLRKPSIRTFAARTGISINIRTIPAKSDTGNRAEAMRQAAAQDLQAQSRIKELSSVLDQGIIMNDLPLEEEIPIQASEVTAMLDKNAEDDTQSQEETEESLPRLPVDPNRISVDQRTNENGGQLSDLSVFRDIFPST